MNIKDIKIQKYLNEYIPKKFPFDSPRRKIVRLSQLKKVLEILNLTKVNIDEVGVYPESIYAYAIKNQMSPGYLTHLIHQINSLQKFFHIHYGKKFIKLECPSGKYKHMVQESFDTSGNRHECDPLTLELLGEIKPKLRKKTWNFFFITLWLGLRPSELLTTKTDPESFKVMMIDDKVVLKIYQNKLHQLKKDDRWKYIPILELQQKEALKLLQQKKFISPSHKMLQKKALTDCTLRIRRYSGRKGFIPMMLKRGYRFEDLSAMLGHRNIMMSLNHYTDNESVQVARIKQLNLSNLVG